MSALWQGHPEGVWGSCGFPSETSREPCPLSSSSRADSAQFSHWSSLCLPSACWARLTENCGYSPSSDSPWVHFLYTDLIRWLMALFPTQREVVPCATQCGRVFSKDNAPFLLTRKTGKLKSRREAQGRRRRVGVAHSRAGFSPPGPWGPAITDRSRGGTMWLFPALLFLLLPGEWSWRWTWKVRGWAGDRGSVLGKWQGHL